MGRERRGRDVLVGDGRDRKEGSYHLPLMPRDEPEIDADEVFDDVGRLPD